jgi:hypothetical protein
MTRDPKPLSQGGDALAAAIAATRDTLPSDERMAALAARLTAAGAWVEDAPAPLSTVAPKPAAPRAEPRLMKLLEPGTLAVIGALLVGAGLIALAISIRGSDVPLVPSSGVPVAAQPGEQAPVAERVPSVDAPAGERALGEAARSPSVSGKSDPRAPLGSDTAAPAAPSNALTGANGPAVVPPSEPTARPTVVSPVSEPAAPASVVAQPQVARRSGASRARDDAQVASTGDTGLAENTVVETEVELLKQARSALGADAIQAFALTERCRAQYPSGSYAQEREYIAISALARMGRTDEARSRASSFRRHYANSAYLPRLARMLGEE